MIKIVNIGAHKTGTESLTALMVSLGYKSIPSGLWYTNSSYQSQVSKGNYQPVIDSINSEYTFFADSPYNLNDVYKFLNRKDTRFILTVRDSKEWYDSFLRWAKKIPYVNSADSDVILGYGAKILEYNRATIIKRYQKRIAEIIDYFCGDICILGVNLSEKDKIDRLSKFLDIKIVQPYPHVNRTK